MSNRGPGVCRKNVRRIALSVRALLRAALTSSLRACGVRHLRVRQLAHSVAYVKSWFTSALARSSRRGLRLASEESQRDCGCASEESQRDLGRASESRPWLQ